MSMDLCKHIGGRYDLFISKGFPLYTIRKTRDQRGIKNLSASPYPTRGMTTYLPSLRYLGTALVFAFLPAVSFQEVDADIKLCVSKWSPGELFNACLEG